MRWTSTRLTTTAAAEWPVIIVFAALPTVGLVSGPSYAGLIYGLGVVQFVALLLVQRRIPVGDRDFALLAVAFAGWCWVSVLWSMDPARSTAAALQMTVILAGSLIFLAGPALTGGAVDRLFGVMSIATLAGCTMFIADRMLGYPLQSLLTGHAGPHTATDYNRGIDHFVLIAWPQIAYFVQRRDWSRVVLVGVAVVIVEATGFSLAGELGTAAGVLVLALALALPRMAPAVIAGGTILYVVTLPFGLHALTAHRMALAPYLKNSGLHRLEIWDFTTQRILEHPVLGWGFGVGGELPITPEELSHYVVQRSQGIYPHNQWLGVWVETGAVGAAIGLAFALLVLSRIRRLDAATRPFAYATFVAALAISSVNFEVKTDSWWGAMLAGIWLLIALNARNRERATPVTRS